MRIEALSKQSYIFASNKLREAVGASQLIAVSTTDWVDEVTAGLGVTVTERVKVSGLAELAISGSSAEEEQAACRALLAGVTTRALRPARVMESEDGGCGLRLLGAWMAVDGEPTEKDRIELIRLLAQHREEVASPLARFPRMPVVAACTTSGGPAAQVLDDKTGDPPRPLSAISIAKRAANWRGRRKIRTKLDHLLADKLGTTPEQLLVASGDLESVLLGEVGWLGVVHADGNRIGDLFTHNSDRTAQLSQALNACTEQALAEAVTALRALRAAADPQRGGARLPLVPLIAGGDDLTTLVDGRYALQFAAAYLRAFTALSAEDPTLSDAARQAGRAQLTASAGVAIVKPHFPFSTAYELCEQACASAKRLAARAQVPALDWHVHYDSTSRGLAAARATLHHDDVIYQRRPYAVLPLGAEPPDAAEGRDWSKLEHLVRTVPVSPHPDPGEALPSSQLQRLRHELIVGGPERASRLFRTLLGRAELAELLHQLGTDLFTVIPDLTGKHDRVRSTLLLDFLDGQFVHPCPDQVTEEEA
ncbi:hypothetical protein M8C13_04985 [Crossiella sp. SN42]|uniref:Cas10/Cmr2 second palm domain-containing protein n=1 Tax=Crossiella sp. SN42 TaxID=2944808 RepID=UPI00207C3899|nr:hypothetical protein [Crossiella sp. SN42]MCO1575112.1 hypothetical protein [Crossiella sp. SN42]